MDTLKIVIQSTYQITKALQYILCSFFLEEVDAHLLTLVGRIADFRA